VHVIHSSFSYAHKSVLIPDCIQENVTASTMSIQSVKANGAASALTTSSTKLFPAPSIPTSNRLSRRQHAYSESYASQDYLDRLSEFYDRMYLKTLIFHSPTQLQPASPVFISTSLSLNQHSLHSIHSTSVSFLGI